MNRSNATGRRRSKGPARQRSQVEDQKTRNTNFAPRKTGIRVIGDMPWGTHICAFYETKRDLLDTVISYFQAGLNSNEFCVWAVADSIGMAEATRALSDAIPEFDPRFAAGQIELLRGREWYLKGHKFDLKRITGGWNEKLNGALAKGYDGMRVSGNALWIESNHWKEFSAYERELDQSLAGQKMIVLCTYSLRASRAVDILDVVRTHDFSVARRMGDWEFLASPELKHARAEIKLLHSTLDILSKRFRGHEALTPRERMTLVQIAKGASTKEAARMLGISPRTIEFHRSNILKKLGAKNSVDLMRKVLHGE